MGLIIDPMANYWVWRAGKIKVFWFFERGQVVIRTRAARLTFTLKLHSFLTSP